MKEQCKHLGLMTDFYQYTAADIFLHNNKNDIATYDMFVRKLPQDWGYFLAGGIDESKDFIEQLQFCNEDLDFMDSMNAFSPELLHYLSKFKFEGDVYSLKEGTPFAPNTPVMRITGRRIDVQILESKLLQHINYPTMVGSKASRIVQSAESRKVAEFGMRRAPGKSAGLDAARMSYIAGFASTSNMEAARKFGIPCGGTIPHAVVKAFKHEMEAFEAAARQKEQGASLLLDTYDPIKAAHKAAIIGLRLKDIGGFLASVRLDSGDLAADSVAIRKILDAAGLYDTVIAGSDDLDEYKIHHLVHKGRFGMFGVGTKNVTGQPAAAIPGVYKVVYDADGGKMKLTEGKRNYPGVKQMFRQINSDGSYSHDVMGMDDEQISGTKLLEPVIIEGIRVDNTRSIHEIREESLDMVSRLPNDVKQIFDSKIYPVTISDKLQKFTDDTIKHLQEEEA